MAHVKVDADKFHAWLKIKYDELSNAAKIVLADRADFIANEAKSIRAKLWYKIAKFLYDNQTDAALVWSWHGTYVTTLMYFKFTVPIAEYRDKLANINQLMEACQFAKSHGDSTVLVTPDELQEYERAS